MVRWLVSGQREAGWAWAQGGWSEVEATGQVRGRTEKRSRAEGAGETARAVSRPESSPGAVQEPLLLAVHVGRPLGFRQTDRGIALLCFALP